MSCFICHSMSFIEHRVKPFGRDRQDSRTLISDIHEGKATQTWYRCRSWMDTVREADKSNLGFHLVKILQEEVSYSFLNMIDI